MKRAAIYLAFAAAVTAALPAAADLGALAPPACTVAEVQASTCGAVINGSRIIVTDGATATECGAVGDSGGGAFEVDCSYSAKAASWVALVPAATSSARLVTFIWYVNDEPDALGDMLAYGDTRVNEDFGPNYFYSRRQPGGPLGLDLRLYEIGAFVWGTLGSNETCKLCVRVSGVTTAICIEIGPDVTPPADVLPYRVRDPGEDSIAAVRDSISYVDPVGVLVESRGGNWGVEVSAASAGTCGDVNAIQLSVVGYEVPE